MKKLISILTILLIAATSYSQGFNLGQIHHHAQHRWGDNGMAPQEWIDSVKIVVPKEYQSFARKTGTMSNTWGMDVPGYNHLRHQFNIDNTPRTNPPTASYIPAFIDFYHKWGFDSMVYTVSSHRAYLEGKENQMLNDLEYVINNGVNVTHICLDNEFWMDWRLCGMSGGSMNLAEKARLLNTNMLFALFMPNSRAEQAARNQINNFLDYLESIVPKIKAIAPDAVILQTVDNVSHLRGRLIWQEVQKRTFFDAITPHIYLTNASTQAQVRQQIRQRLNQYGSRYPIYVTEFNYNFGNDCSGGNPPQLVKDKEHIRVGLDEFSKHPQVKHVFIHTLWHGDVDCNGYLRKW